MRPVIHLTNFASRKLHTSLVLSIMAMPRRWEHGSGRVHALVPAVADLTQIRSGGITIDVYKARFLAMPRDSVAPGVMQYTPVGWVQQTGNTAAMAVQLKPRVVPTESTLCCACSRVLAAGGCCHRVWAAELLGAAGWAVVLDGVLQSPSPTEA